MKKVITTNRLYLREFSHEDAEALYYLNSNENVLRFTGDEPFKSVTSAKTFIENYKDYEKNGFGRWAVIQSESNKFVGWCGLKRHSDGMVDLGFRFFEDEWNKGYATESAAACLDFGLNQLNLNEIVGRAALENKASIRVLEKIGMKFWKNAPCDGIEDAIYYRISKDEFLL